jgi:lactoylglutathione lyase
MQLRYSIIFVSDLDRSRRFYADLLAIPILSEDRSSIELDTGIATLALHQAHLGEGHHHSPTAAGSLRIGFVVDDLKATHRKLIEGGVPCLSVPEERFDFTVGLYEDPDGIQFTLAERRH